MSKLQIFDITTVLAIFSLLVSLTTLMLTQLRPAKITCSLGPWILFAYTDNKGSVSIQIPVTFNNHGVIMGNIFRAAIILRQKGALSCNFIQWYSFLKLDIEANKWLHDEPARALAITGKSIVAKTVLFGWLPNSEHPLVIKEGAYELEFYFWTSDTEVPRYEKHQFEISSANLALLEGKENQPRKSISVQLDQSLELNRSMSESDVTNLRNQPLKKKGAA